MGGRVARARTPHPPRAGGRGGGLVPAVLPPRLRRVRKDHMSNLHLRSPALLIPPAAGERKGAISLRARCHWLHSRCRRAARDNTPPQPLLRQCLTGCAACVIATVALLILTLIIGVSVEGAAVAAAPSTLRYLRPNETCARNASSGAFATFPTRAALRASGNATVAHCAACGACSTDADVGVLRATAATLTATMTACAPG